MWTGTIPTAMLISAGPIRANYNTVCLQGCLFNARRHASVSLSHFCEMFNCRSCQFIAHYYVVLLGYKKNIVFCQLTVSLFFTLYNVLEGLVSSIYYHMWIETWMATTGDRAEVNILHLNCQWWRQLYSLQVDRNAWWPLRKSGQVWHNFLCLDKTSWC